MAALFNFRLLISGFRRLVAGRLSLAGCQPNPADDPFGDKRETGQRRRGRWKLKEASLMADKQ